MSSEDKFYELQAVRWDGKLHCCYLNNFRIAGGKPWAGGQTVKTWRVRLDDLSRAIPEVAEWKRKAEQLDAARAQLAAEARPRRRAVAPQHHVCHIEQ